MRTLARFPDQGSLTRLPVELSMQPVTARKPGPMDPLAAAAREPAEDRPSAAACGDATEESTDGVVTDALVAEAIVAEVTVATTVDPDPPVETVGGRVAAFVFTLLAPPRRRKPPKKIGWGSIAFLTMIAVGVWTLAWWQSGEETKRPWEHATARVASQPSTTVEGTVR